MADANGLPEGAVVEDQTPAQQPAQQANGLPEGAVIGPALQPSGKEQQTAPKAAMPEGAVIGPTIKTKAPVVAPKAAPAGPTDTQQHDQKIVNGIKGYAGGLANSVGLPESTEEYKQQTQGSSDLTPTNVLRMLGGPAESAIESGYGLGKKYLTNMLGVGKQAYEAGQNIGAGQPILRNLAKPASALAEATVGAVPFIGEPTVQAGHDIAQGQYAHAAGEMTGVLGQVLLPELQERFAKDPIIKFHDEKVAEAQKALDIAKKPAEPYVHSAAQGIQPPAEMQKPITKAQEKLDEAVAHRDLAKEAIAKQMSEARTNKTAPVAPAAPEVPAEKVEAAPQLNKLGAAKPAPAIPQMNVKTPGQVQPETFPQTPTERPRTPLGRMELAGGQGTVGTPRMLTEGTPEGPKIPEGGLPKIKPAQEVLPPVKAAKPERGNVKALTVDEKGNVIDKEDTPEGRMGRLLKEAMTPGEKAAKTPVVEQPAEKAPEVKAEAPAEKRAEDRRQEAVPVEDERRQGERRVLQGINEKAFQESAFGTGGEKRVDTDAYAKATEQARKELGPDASKEAVIARRNELVVPEAKGATEDVGAKAREANPEPTREETKLPNEEKTGYAAKKEEIVPAGEEGREGAKSAAEYHPAVQEQVFHLSNDNLDKLATAHGIDPKAPEYSRAKEMRNEGRHQTGRQKLAEDITAQMGDDEKINIGRNAENLEHNAAMANKTKAERAESLFPRLRGAVDEFGNPKASGGSQGADEEKATGYSLKADKRYPATTVGGAETVETAKSDNEHFANAKKELGDKASISDIAKRAQEMKDTTAQLAAHDKNGGSTFSSKGKDLNGTNNYSVGSYPDRTEQVDKLTPERLDEFKKKNADVLSKDDHAVGTWKDPDTGKAVLDVAKTYIDRDKAIAAGKAANQKAIYHLGGEGEIQTGGTGEVNAKGSPIDEFGNPTVSGGAPEKKLPTGDQLIKKYGESSGDPKDLTFILKDGRGVANTGMEHDHMLGGRTDEKVPPRERFIADGNIRVRPRQGVGGREVALSIPEQGVNQDQLKYIQKMSPQLKSGAVMIEVGKPGGGYKVIPYGEASSENIEKSIREIAPILNDKGSPIDEHGNPTVSGGSQGAGVGKAKEAITPEELKKNLPDLAQQHLTEAEKESVTTTGTGLPRTAGTQKFIHNMEDIPSVQEYTDIAKQGEGARKWYSRSTAAFDAMHEEAPDYFKDGDKEKFLGVLAGSSPQQAVASNLRETLGLWKNWVDAGRPELTLDKWKKFGDVADEAWKEDGSPRVRGLAKGASMHWDYAPKGPEWKNENMLLTSLTLPETKVPNIIKALNGEQMWPDLQKNKQFKAPSFAENLKKWINGESTGTKNVTNDSWMGLFGGIDKSALSRPENYHPLSVATRAAAEALGWEPEEAQAAIWSFTQALTEKGTEDPEVVRHYSEDFKDLLANDLDARNLLKDLGVNLDQLDTKLEAIGEKPQVSGGSTPTTANSVGKLRSRIEKARGKGAIPEPKTIQGSLFRENPAFEQRANPGAGHTRVGPTELEQIQADEKAKADKLAAEKTLNEATPLRRLGSKDTAYKDKDTLFDPEEFENEEPVKKKSPLGRIR
jgi:hypothetical protein